MSLSNEEMLSGMFSVADDGEATVLQNLLVRAGWRWRCQVLLGSDKERCCNYINSMYAEKCEACGAERPRY